MNKEIKIIGGASGFTEIEVEDEIEQMKDINELIKNYTNEVRQGDIKHAYKIIINFMKTLQGRLAADFNEFQVSSSIYQGPMDVTFISLTTEILKERSLKIVIAYVHDKGTFEAWLSGRNRNTTEKYRALIDDVAFNNIKVYHHIENRYAAMECVLIGEPDFQNEEALIEVIEKGIVKFIDCISKSLLK